MKHIISVLLSVSLGLVTPLNASPNDSTPATPEMRNERKIFWTAYQNAGGFDLIPSDVSKWLPYPEYSDRDGWNKLFAEFREPTIKRGENSLSYQWDHTYGKQISLKNRDHLTRLMLAELAEGQGRFIPKIVELTREFISQMSLATNTDRFPNGGTPIELGSSAAMSLLGVDWYFFHDAWASVDPTLGSDLQAKIHKEVLDEFIDCPENKYWWMGFTKKFMNNWTPYCNFHILSCFLLCEQDRDRLRKALERSIRSVDNYMDFVPLDGSCDEGPGYWSMAGGRVYDYARLLCDATCGKVNVFADSQFRNMGEWRTGVEPGGGWVVNFADSSPNSGKAAELLMMFGQDTGSELMKAYAVNRLREEDGSFKAPAFSSISDGDILRGLSVLRYLPALKDAENSITDPEAILSRGSLYYAGVQTAFMRYGDFFLGAKGGHNAESHNHNDIGSAVFYIDAIPILVDLGTNHSSYAYQLKKAGLTSKYQIWSVNSNYHNCPAPNGFNQAPGKASAAADVEYKDNTLTMNLAAAYPDSAACLSWVRTWSLSNKGVALTDKYELSERKAPDSFSFMVWGEVSLPKKAGEILIKGMSSDRSQFGYAVLKYPSGQLNVYVEDVALDDATLKKHWKDSVHRIVLKSRRNAPLKGSYRFEITQYEKNIPKHCSVTDYDKH